MKKHDAISKEYFRGRYHKRQIVYRSIPDEIQKSVDAEVAKQQPQTYEEFIDFVKVLAKSARLKSLQAPKPLTDNFVS